MPAESPAHAEVVAAQRRFWAALCAKDRALFEQVLAPGFVARSPGQPDQDRAAFVAALVGFPATVLEVGSDNLAVHLFGEAAVVTGVQRARVALPNGPVVENVIAITNVFVRGAQGWQLALAHPVELA